MRTLEVMRTVLLVVGGLYCLVLLGCAVTQRSMLYFPTHRADTNGLSRWVDGDRTIGFAREVPKPHAVWLMLHGNAGQAADRTYALPCFAENDSAYIMEYPGYGARPGAPSRETFDGAAASAYQALRTRFPNTPICVVGESIGSGPACSLASQPTPPDKISLVVPFDTLANVAAGHIRFLPVRWLLRDKWDNVSALSGYRGRVEIFGAENDTVIPVRHAKALAASLRQAEFHLLRGGHNDWSSQSIVRFRY